MVNRLGIKHTIYCMIVRQHQVRLPGTERKHTKIFSKELRNYLQTSTLHGLRYIGQRELTWCER